jgi:hypothetical protein
LAGHPQCAALISFFQYDSASNPRLFAVIVAKKIEVLLKYITVYNTGTKSGLAMIAYSSSISKETGMITRIEKP